MTIGEKIKYLRKCLNITQNNLADRANIHSVSIRKYETNKMKPQPTQIEKLAKALNVSPFAFIDDYKNLKLKTKGDYYSVIILLYKTGIMNLNLDENGKIRYDFNKSFTKTITDDDVLFKQWIIYMHNLNNFIDSVSNLNNPIVIDTINNYKEKIEILELELQQSVERLPPINANNKKKEDLLIEKLSTLVNKNNPYWKGTATELAEILGLEIKSNILSRKLNNISDGLYEKHNICYKRYRTSEYRGIELTFIKK